MGIFYNHIFGIICLATLNNLLFLSYIINYLRWKRIALYFCLLLTNRFFNLCGAIMNY